MIWSIFHPDTRRVLRLLGVFLGLATAPVSLSGQGLTYTLSPSAKWIEWDEDLASSQTRLFGGSVGIGFGRYVGLQAFHHQESDLKLFQVDPESSFEAPLFDFSQSGAQVSLAFGTGTIVPVLAGGGSVLRFEPAGGERSTKLSLDAGAGFRAILGETLHGEVMLESTQYRLDRMRLIERDPSSTGVAALRRNLTLRAGLGLQLGRRTFDRASDLDDAFTQRYQAPFANFALAVEPTAGVLDYDKAVGLEDQESIGIRAGVELGSFFGLRGFHLWVTEGDSTTVEEWRAWGGEAQFRLGAGPGINPYLTGGAGQLSWGKAKEGEDPRPVDQPALIPGGGFDFNPGPRIRATASARDFVLAGSDLSGEADLQAISDPDELVHNWQFSAGLKFLVGRTGIRSGRGDTRTAEAAARMTAEEFATAEIAAARDRLAAEEAARAAELDARQEAVARWEEALREAAAEVGLPVPEVEQVVLPGVDREAMIRAREEAVESGQVVVVRADPVRGVPTTGRTIVLPILERGEICIRSASREIRRS